MSANQQSNPAAEIEALKELYAALNRNDAPAVLEYCHPRIERIEPGDLPSARTYHGHAEMEAHVSRALETWAEGSCEPEEFIVAGDKIVTFVHVLVRLKGQQEWIDARIADGFIFQEGKVIQMRTFVEREQALEWAGIDMPV